MFVTSIDNQFTDISFDFFEYFVTTAGSTGDILLSSTYQHMVNYLPFIILFDVHLSYRLISKPKSFNFFENSLYQNNADLMQP